MRILLSLAITLGMSAYAVVLTSSGTSDAKSDAASASMVVLTSDVEWRPLNPARGDKGPQAGTLWGDRTSPGPSGFLVAFVDGFSSPPHIHNTSYRGVVISGLIHNDDPDAEDMWMPGGSFWTQPTGEAHITAADGHRNIVYVEIEEGPYLVLPTEKVFDNGERPLNVDESNIVWLNAAESRRGGRPGMDVSSRGPQMAFLWGQPKDGHLNGTLVKLTAEFTGEVRSLESTFRAVVIQGRPDQRVLGEAQVQNLEPGGYFGSDGEAVHQVTCVGPEDCVIYVRTQGTFDVVPVQPKE